MLWSSRSVGLKGKGKPCTVLQKSNVFHRYELVTSANRYWRPAGGEAGRENTKKKGVTFACFYFRFQLVEGLNKATLVRIILS